MNDPRKRSLARLLAGLDQDEQKFLLDWLADYAVHPSDDAFISAALTARLIIEQQRLGDRNRTDANTVVNAISQASTVLSREADALKKAAMSMRTEGAGWKSSATEGIEAGLAATLDVAISKLGDAVDNPLAPVLARLEFLEMLPESVKSAATLGASTGARDGASAWLNRQIRRIGWRLPLGVVAMAIMLFALGFGVARWTEPHVVVYVHGPPQHR